MASSRKPRRALPVVYEPRELELRAWLQLIRTFSKQSRQVERALDRHGLSLAQFDVLATLRLGDGISQQELASRLLVTKGNVCSLIDRMEASGWVARKPDPEDGRANRLHLTKEGRRLLDETMPEHHAAVQGLMGVLSAAELQSFHRLLDRLEDAADG